jgi:hypothetical protein
MNRDYHHLYRSLEPQTCLRRCTAVPPSSRSISKSQFRSPAGRSRCSAARGEPQGRAWATLSWIVTTSWSPKTQPERRAP